MKSKLRPTYEVKLYGDLKSFLRWSISRPPSEIQVNQTSYAKRILKNFGMEHCKHVKTPPLRNADLLPRSEKELPLSITHHNTYRAIIGSVSYLATSTGPDLTFSVSLLSTFLHNPCYRHLAFAKRMLLYVSGTLSSGLHFPRFGSLNINSLCAEVDSDWGGDIGTTRSTTGFFIAINHSPVYWTSKRQTIIAFSSGEGEYVALSACTNELTWIRKLWSEILEKSPWNEKYPQPTNIYVDSATAISIASKEQFSAMTKHIYIKIRHILGSVNKDIKLVKTSTQYQPAHILTKSQAKSQIENCIAMLRLDGFNF